MHISQRRRNLHCMRTVLSFPTLMNLCMLHLFTVVKKKIKWDKRLQVSPLPKDVLLLSRASKRHKVGNWLRPSLAECLTAIDNMAGELELDELDLVRIAQTYIEKKYIQTLAHKSHAFEVQIQITTYARFPA